MKVKVLNTQTQVEIREMNLGDSIDRSGECLLGRSPNSGLVLDSPDVSRLHAKFLHQHGQYYFCDLGSSNGSIVQGGVATANQNYLLQPGDVVRLGDFVLLLEATPEPSEELAPTVIGGLDATVIAGYTNPVTPINASSDSTSQADESNQREENEPVIVAELVEEESAAIVRVEPREADYSLHGQTKALFTAINQRVIAELKAAGSLTRDTYLKAIRKARESVERDRLIDPDQFEKEAEKYWQSVARNTSVLGARLGATAAKGASNLGSRLGAAAKAAWSEFLAHQPESRAQQLEAAEEETSPPERPTRPPESQA
ncbi:MAG TPA: FHA domain-containing protein [Allocoleopsis sp.]